MSTFLERNKGFFFLLSSKLFSQAFISWSCRVSFSSLNPKLFLLRLLLVHSVIKTTQIPQVVREPMQPGTFVQSVCPVPMLMETFYTIILRRKQQGTFRKRVFSGKVKGIKLTRKIQFSQKYCLCSSSL